MYCISCNYNLKGSNERCPECGRPFSPNDATTYNAYPSAPQTVSQASRVFLVVSVVLVMMMLAILIFGGFVMMKLGY